MRRKGALEKEWEKKGGKGRRKEPCQASKLIFHPAKPSYKKRVKISNIYYHLHIISIISIKI